MKKPHPQKRIKYKDMVAEVDCGIAPLILALWRRGFRTLFSCEGYKSDGLSGDLCQSAYISFADWETCLLFIAKLGKFLPWFEISNHATFTIYFNKRYIEVLSKEVKKVKGVKTSL